MSVCAVGYGTQIAVIVKNDAAVTDKKKCCPKVKCEDLNLWPLDGCEGNPGVCSSGSICPDCATCGTIIDASSLQDQYPDLDIPDSLQCLDCNNYDSCECIGHFTTKPDDGNNYVEITVPPGAAYVESCDNGTGDGDAPYGQTTTELTCWELDEIDTCECVGYYTTQPDWGGPWGESVIPAGTARLESCGGGVTYEDLTCWTEGDYCECVGYYTTQPGWGGPWGESVIPAGTARLESCGGGVTYQDLTCWTEGDYCECVGYYTTQPDWGGPWGEATIPAGTARVESCGGGKSSTDLVCWVEGDYCECVGYYTTQPGWGGPWGEATIPAGTARLESCGGGVTYEDLTCWVEGDTCECIGYYTTQPDWGGPWGEATIPAGAARVESCGGGKSSTDLTCWVEGDTCECIGYYTTEPDWGGPWGETTIPAGAARVESCGGGKSSTDLVCWVEGDSCECVGFHTTQPTSGGPWGEATIPAGTARLESCGGGSTYEDLTCWVESESCECLQDTGYYSSSPPDATWTWSEYTLPYFMPISDGCGGGATQTMLTCWAEDPPLETCECVGNYYTDQPATGGPYYQTTIPAGAAIAESCGGSETTNDLTCWTEDILDTCECIGHFTTKPSDDYIEITVPPGAAYVESCNNGTGDGDAPYGQTTTELTCWELGSCLEPGLYSSEADAPCNPARTRTDSNGYTCYHCDAVCSDLGTGWSDTDCSSCSVTTYNAGNAAGNSGYTFAEQTDCYLDEGPCSCLTCTQEGGGSWHQCAYGAPCEYLSAWCGDFNLEDQDNSGAGYTCTPQKINAGECGNGAYAAWGLDCWSCSYTGTPFEPLGIDGEYVFVGLEKETTPDILDNSQKTMPYFAPLGVDGEYIFIGT